METASEVGGDFYDILPQEDGSTIIGIGDVTDHGLQSGIVMLMTQSALRTSIDKSDISLKKALQQVNNLIYSNVQTRLNDNRNLTLALLKYKENKIQISGQHEYLILLRKENSKAEKINTLDLGFYVGMLKNIDKYIEEQTFDFNEGDIILLYTDGATEAENRQKEFYGIDRLIAALEKNRNTSSQEIVENIKKDIFNFINGREILDDISLVVIKRT